MQGTEACSAAAILLSTEGKEGSSCLVDWSVNDVRGILGLDHFVRLRFFAFSFCFVLNIDCCDRPDPRGFGAGAWPLCIVAGYGT